MMMKSKYNILFTHQHKDELKYFSVGNIILTINDDVDIYDVLSKQYFNPTIIKITKIN